MPTMNQDSADLRYIQFLSYLGTLRTTEYLALLSWVEKHPEDTREIFERLSIGDGIQEQRYHIQPVPTGDPSNWSDDKRARANQNALVALRAMESDGRTVPTDLERAAMRAYSGWGGLDFKHIFAVDLDLYNPEYAETFSRFKEQLAKGRIPEDRGGLLGRLKDQHFTPQTICDGMAKLASRVSLFSFRRALEPSAGTGRMLQGFTNAGGGELDWTLVEYDGQTADLLEAIYSDHYVRKGIPFEEFVREALPRANQRFDLILSNPPYMDRQREVEVIDAIPGVQYKREEAYFSHRSLELLAPGGVLVTITPASQLDGADHKDVRREMLKRGKLLTAVYVSGNLFAGGVSIPLVIHAWMRLAADRPETSFSPTDRRILNGEYRTMMGDEQTVMGSWVRGRFEGQLAIRGDWSEDFLLAAPSLALLSEEVDEIRAARAAMPAPPTSRIRAASASDRLAQPAQAIASGSGTVFDQAKGLSDRIASFVQIRRANPRLAETGRKEILADVQTFLKVYGNPHAIHGIAVYASEVGTLLAAVRASGEIAPILSESVSAEAEQDLPQDGLSVIGTIDWYCLRKGYADFSDLVVSGFVEDEIEDAVTTNRGVFFDLSGPGAAGSREAMRLYNQSSYSAGLMSERLERVESDRKVIEGTSDLVFRDKDALLARLTDQLTYLMQISAPKSYVEIGVTPRSPYIFQYGTENPASLLEEFVNAQLKFLEQNWHGHISVTVDSGGLNFEETTDYSHDPGVKESEKEGGVQFLWLSHCVGYCLRQTQINHPWRKKNPARADAYRVSDFNLRLAEDSRLEGEFTAWLSNNPDAARIVESNYEKSLNSLRGREYDTGPLPLLRLAPNMSLRGFQNATIRRYEALGGLVCAFDVGLGKTSTALGSIALERQSGRARRPVVVMPNAVVVNWYKECRKFFPTFRVGMIGFTSRNGGKTFQPCSKSERNVQWQRYMVGDFDLLLCPYSNFIRDTGVTIDTASEVIGRTAYARAVYTQEVKQAIYNLKLAKFNQEKLAEHQKEFQRLLSRGADTSNVQKLIDEANKSLAKATAALGGAVSETDVLDMRKTALLKASEKLKTLLKAQPWRPRSSSTREWSPSDKLEDLLAYLMEFTESGDDLGSRGVQNVLDYIRERMAETEDEEAIRKHQDLLEILNPLLTDKIKPGKTKKAPPIIIPAGFVYDRPEGGLSYRVTKGEIGQILDVINPYIGKASGSTILEPLVKWEDVGCDMLVVDEAHNFKNLWGLGNVVGESKIQFMGSHGEEPSARAYDLFLKAQHVLATTQGRGVLLLTGTPAKNSPLEVYNLLSYISPDLWTRLGIDSPDQWVSRYLIIGADIGLSSTEMAPRQQPTVKRFNPDTIEELQTAFTYLDYKQPADVPELRIAIPKFERTLAMLQLDPKQKEVTDKLILILRSLAGLERDAQGQKYRRVLRMRMDPLTFEPISDANGNVEFYWEPIEDGKEGKKTRSIAMLLCIDYLLKTCLDMRLLRDARDRNRKEAMDEAEIVRKYTDWLQGGQRGKQPKKPAAEQREYTLKAGLTILEYLRADEMAAYHDNHIPPKYAELGRRILEKPNCGHLVFCSYASLLPYVKETLASMGVNPSRIGLLAGSGVQGEEESSKDAGARERMAELYNGNDAEELLGIEARDPEFDVLIGTSVMEEGMNLQRRTCALHHLSMPWEPATLKQRNGRGVRQGNKYGSVDVVYYLIERSVDVFRLNQIDGKASWLDSLFQAGKTELNSPIAEEALERAEMVIQLITRTQEEYDEAMADYRSLKAQQHQEDIADRIRRFVVKGAAAQFRQARKTQDPIRRAAYLAQAEQSYQRAMGIPDVDFPTKFILDLCRDRDVYVNPMNPRHWAAAGRNIAWAVKREWSYVSKTAIVNYVPLEILDISIDGGSVSFRAQGSADVKRFIPTNKISQELARGGQESLMVVDSETLEELIEGREKAGQSTVGYSPSHAAHIRDGVLWLPNAGPAFDEVQDRNDLAKTLELQTLWNLNRSFALPETLREDKALVDAIWLRTRTSLPTATYSGRRAEFLNYSTYRGVKLAEALPWASVEDIRKVNNAFGTYETMVSALLLTDSAGRVYYLNTKFLNAAWEAMITTANLPWFHNVEGTRKKLSEGILDWFASCRPLSQSRTEWPIVDKAINDGEVYYFGFRKETSTYEMTRIDLLATGPQPYATENMTEVAPEMLLGLIMAPVVSLRSGKTYFEKVRRAQKRRRALAEGRAVEPSANVQEEIQQPKRVERFVPKGS